MHRSS